MVMGSEIYDFFFLSYDWAFFETKDGYDVFINSFRVIPFNKVRIFFSTQNKKIQEIFDKSRHDSITFDHMDEEFIKEQIEMLEDRIEFMNNQIIKLKNHKLI